jgi:DNA topoisomerase I
VDPQVRGIVAALKRRRGGGEELLAFRDGRHWRDLRSDDINAYIKDATSEEFSAKDFRTWNATVLAAVALSVSGPVAASKTGRERAVARAVKEVAHYLGNTPAVCRASYIDPRVFDAYRAGLVIGRPLQEAVGSDNGQLPINHRGLEEAVLDLINERESSRALERVAA